MRTIKFRGKSTRTHGHNPRTGEWIYGSLCLYPTPHIYNLDEIYPIDPVTIGQFTGLHDRNGKEIYEGDIVQSIGTPELVQWKFFCEGDGNPVAGYCFTHGVEFVSENVLDCEVIGNVHDNPELVEVSE